MQKHGFNGIHVALWVRWLLFDNMLALLTFQDGICQKFNGNLKSSGLLEGMHHCPPLDGLVSTIASKLTHWQGS